MKNLSQGHLRRSGVDKIHSSTGIVSPFTCCINRKIRESDHTVFSRFDTFMTVKNKVFGKQ